jgi:ABC-type enterochelin transport system ATPase subunit
MVIHDINQVSRYPDNLIALKSGAPFVEGRALARG